MNKTVNINIGGLVFHLEEAAYEALKKYMHEIKAYFSQSADDVEIVTDIENRIAEMFSDILKAGQREVIVLKDVEDMIAQIGQVSDFQEAEETQAGGTKARETEGPRRLYRDPDDKKLGGVCSGISHYFGWDPVWLRIIAVILAVVSSGVAVIVYLVLWLIMPQAGTLAEKMAMKGERFHLSNFKKSFDEGMEDIRTGFDNFTNDMRSPERAASFKNFVNEVVDLIARIIRALGRILLPVLAIALAALGAFWLIGTFTGLAAFLGLADGEMTHYFPFSIVEPQYKSYFVLSIAGLLGIPALALLLLGIRLLTGKKIINSSVGLVMLGLWLVAMGFSIYYGTVTASGFRKGASIRQITELQPATGNTYYLRLDEYTLQASPGLSGVLPEGPADTIALGTGTAGRHGMHAEYHLWSDYDPDFDDWDDEAYEADLKIEQSHSGKPALVRVYSSRGKNVRDAADHAGTIRYGFSQTDSILNFSRHFSLLPGALWRAQRVHLTLQLPGGSTLIIDPKLRGILKNRNVHHRDFDGERRWMLTPEGLEPAGRSGTEPADTAPGHTVGTPGGQATNTTTPDTTGGN